jgi:hypothetical protein
MITLTRITRIMPMSVLWVVEATLQAVSRG